MSYFGGCDSLSSTLSVHNKTPAGKSGRTFSCFEAVENFGVTEAKKWGVKCALAIAHVNAVCIHIRGFDGFGQRSVFRSEMKNHFAASV